MRKHQTVNAILTAPWMIEPKTASQLAPRAAQIIAGESIMEEEDQKDPCYFVNASGATVEAKRPTGQQAPGGESYVAIYEIHGVITKHDQFCGPRGTVSLMRQMEKNEKDPAIVAHVLDIESGGGEATNIETVARFIRGLEKPVLSSYNGLCCSAAYYIAAAGDEIYATEQTDLVGSIGTLITFLDFREYYEKQGVKLHEIYASQSELKNAPFRAALDGDYEPIRTQLLDPYAQQFIQTIQEFRPGVQEEDAYKGQTYMADDAVKIGMIDGVKRFAEVLDLAFQAGRDRNDGAQLSNDQNHVEMDKTQNYPNLLQALSYETIEADAEGGIYLSPEELAVLEGHLRENQGPTDEQLDAISKLQATVDSLKSTVEAQDQRMEDLAQQVAEYGDQTADPDPTRIEKKEDVRQLSAEEKAFDNFNAELADIAESGSRANFQ